MPHPPRASSRDIVTDALLVEASVGDLDILSEDRSRRLVSSGVADAGGPGVGQAVGDALA
jgi:hypothetical protein